MRVISYRNRIPLNRRNWALFAQSGALRASATASKCKLHAHGSASIVGFRIAKTTAPSKNRAEYEGWVLSPTARAHWEARNAPASEPQASEQEGDRS